MYTSFNARIGSCLGEMLSGALSAPWYISFSYNRSLISKFNWRNQDKVCQAQISSTLYLYLHMFPKAMLRIHNLLIVQIEVFTVSVCVRHGQTYSLTPHPSFSWNKDACIQWKQMSDAIRTSCNAPTSTGTYLNFPFSNLWKASPKLAEYCFGRQR